MSDWTVSRLDPVTGDVGRVLICDATSGSWADGPLNGIPEVKIDIAKSGLVRTREDGQGLPEVVRRLWEHGMMPWRDGLLVCVDGTPLVAGPLTAIPAENLSTVSLTAGGIEALLAQWLILRRNYELGDQLKNDSSLKVEAGSLSRLAWALVKQSMDRCGQLPIIPGMPEAASTGHYRTIEQWNLQNNNLWKRLQEITEVIDGPDLAFRPEWVPGMEGRRIRWRMVGGSELSPHIGQEHVPVIDLTAPVSGVADVKPTVAWTPATRVYGYGSGQGSGMIVSMAYADDQLRYRLPVIESVMADGGNEDWPLLQKHVDAEVAAKSALTTQVPVTLACDDPSVGVSQWWTGDACRLIVGDDWLLLPQQDREWRCIKRSGAIGAATYTAELQEV